MSPEQVEFARRVLEAFAIAGRHTDQEVSDAGGPSSTTMTTLRKLAKGETRVSGLRSDTLRRIDAAAGWATGAAKNMWMHGDAEPTSYAGTVSGRGVAFARAGDPRQLDIYMRQLESRVLEVEERLEAVESRLSEGGQEHGQRSAEKSDEEAAGLTVVPKSSEADGSIDDAIAAHEDGSIAGEQGSMNET